MLKIRYRVTLVICFIVISIYFLYNRSSTTINNMMYDRGILIAVLKSYNFANDPLNGPETTMEDPKLVNKLKRDFLIAPVENRPLNLEVPEVIDQSVGQGAKIREILKNKLNGFFIEVGALDGETRSNTLYFERYMNWTGLLIEPDPLNFADLMKRNRKAWLSPTCLSIKPHAEIVQFEQNRNMGRIVGLGVEEGGGTQKSTGIVNVQCFPLYTYLLAINVTQIDYFSLDVEGAELQVLKTIPFDKINIQTLSVEFAHVVGGKSALTDFMFENGYIVHSEVTHPDWCANDFIFMKK